MSIESLSYTEAIAQLTELMSHPENVTKADLTAIVERVSVVDPQAGPNSTTYLYSGSITAGSYSGDLAAAIAEAEGTMARIIDRTSAGEFLNDVRFLDSLETAFKNENPAFALPENATQLTEAVNNYLYDATDGPWANRSAAFVEITAGNVECIVPDAQTGRVWWETELPRLLANQNVQSINGIPKADLISIKNDFINVGYAEGEATSFIRQIITLESRLRLSTVEYATNAQGEAIWTNIAKLTSGSSTIAPEGPGITKVACSDLIGVLSQTDLSAYSELKSAMNKVVYTPKYFEALNTTGKVIGSVGVVLIGVSAAFAAHDAYEAYQAGDTAACENIIQDWLLSMAGAIAGSGITTSVAAPILAGLASLGPWGVAAGVVGVFTAGIFGAVIGYEAGHAFSELMDELRALFQEAEGIRSPLIIDLDGDGVETISLAHGIHFDHDNNGFAEQTGWVDQDDGLLVRDINGNGLIDNGSELFGNNTLLNNGEKAANGFAALAELDENHDGKIDSSDAAYSQLRVWKDTDGDGVTDAGELMSLGDAGVASIATGYNESMVTDAQGNQHLQNGTYTKADGTTASVDDVWFKADLMHTKATEILEETPEIAGLPDLQGFGNVYSLHQAMLRDSSGHLHNLLNAS